MALAVMIAVLLGGCTVPGLPGAQATSSAAPTAAPTTPTPTAARPTATRTPNPTATAKPTGTAKPDATNSRSRSPTPTAGVQRGVVDYVFDGDTVDVKGVGKVRMVGIDAPELEACGHDQARRALSKLVLGKKVTLTPGGDDDHDRYGRLLRYVDVGNKDAGLTLITKGWAIARYDGRDGYDPHPREKAYRAADATSTDKGCYDRDG